MNLTKPQAILFSIVAAIVLFFLLGFLGVIPIFKPPQQNSAPDINLTIWGIEDDIAMRPFIDKYTAININARITYRKIDENNYESVLLDALASRKGPDIFMFHRSWLSRHENKIVPASEAQVPFIKMGLYPDIVAKDFSANSKVYALPLYLDSLALFYNKDIFNSKSITFPPATWNDLKNLIPYLAEFDSARQIKKPAVAIGGSAKSIGTASDILTLLMLQMNSQVVNKTTGEIRFDQNAMSAFNFYLQFSNPSSQYYTWNNDLGDSLDSFSSGNTAMIIDYARKIPLIKKKNPFLNFAVAPVPQFNPSAPVNYSDYWGLAVSNQSTSTTYAWNFVAFAASNAENSQGYLTAVNLPPALKVLINQLINDPQYSVFARQSFTATSIPYYKPAYSQAISNMIELVLNGRLSPNRALSQTASELNP